MSFLAGFGPSASFSSYESPSTLQRLGSMGDTFLGGLSAAQRGQNTMMQMQNSAALQPYAQRAAVSSLRGQSRAGETMFAEETRKLQKQLCSLGMLPPEYCAALSDAAVSGNQPAQPQYAHQGVSDWQPGAMGPSLYNATWG